MRINIPNIYNNIIDISGFQTELNVHFSSTGFYFKSKAIESSPKRKNMFFLNFWALLPKMDIFEVVTFFSDLVVVQSTQFSSGSTYLLDPRFWWSIFLLFIRMIMVTKIFRVLTCCEELSTMNMHDILMEWFCTVTWKIKYISQPAEDILISQ